MKKILKYLKKRRVWTAILLTRLIYMCFNPPDYDVYNFLYSRNNNKNISYGTEDSYENYSNRENMYNGMVLQKEEGVYYVYNNKLMLMQNNGTYVTEVKTMDKNIFGLAKLGENVIFSDEKNIYKVKDDITKIVNVNSDVRSTNIRTYGNYIYKVTDKIVEKYDINGKIVSKGEINDINSVYQPFIKDDYIIHIGNFDDLTVEKPSNYILNPYFKKYNATEFRIVKEPDSDSGYFTDKQFIELERYFLNQVELGKGKTIDDYYTSRMRISDAYISQVYNNELYTVSGIDSIIREGNRIKKDEKQSYSFFSPSLFICRAKVDLSIDKGCYDTDFDIIYSGLGEVSEITSMMIKDGYIFFIVGKNGEYYLYRKNIENGELENIYHFDTKEIRTNDIPWMLLYTSKDWIFVYMRYFNDINNYDVAILRLDNDGKNPVLVMNTEGEVVMKPLETDK